jgi:hypothetical protein
MKSALKKGKKIWYEDKLWTIKEIIHPNKFQTILSLHCYDETACYEGKTKHQNFARIDINGNVFYPDSDQVRAKINLIKIYQDRAKKLERELNDIWYDAIDF